MGGELRPYKVVAMRAIFLTALITAGLAVGSGVAIAQNFIPDPARTPGAINPHVTQDNATLTVCVAGWTRTIRPTSSYTSKLKAQQIGTLHLPGKARDYEEDHLVPLCVGGHPTDHRNLWPQPRRGQWSAKIKDQLEGSVCRAVCRGAMTLEEGRAIFLWPDWTKEYGKFFGLE